MMIFLLLLIHDTTTTTTTTAAATTTNTTTTTATPPPVIIISVPNPFTITTRNPTPVGGFLFFFSSSVYVTIIVYVAIRKLLQLRADALTTNY